MCATHTYEGYTRMWLSSRGSREQEAFFSCVLLFVPYEFCTIDIMYLQNFFVTC